MRYASNKLALSLLTVFVENQQHDGSGKAIKEIIVTFIRKLTKSVKNLFETTASFRQLYFFTGGLQFFFFASE